MNFLINFKRDLMKIVIFKKNNWKLVFINYFINTYIYIQYIQIVAKC